MLHFRSFKLATCGAKEPKPSVAVRIQVRILKVKIEFGKYHLSGCVSVEKYFNDHPEICKITIDAKLIEFFIF